VAVEMLLMRMAQSGADVSIDNLLAKLTALEKRLKGSHPDPSPPEDNPHGTSYVREAEASEFSAGPAGPTSDEEDDLAAADDDIPEPLEVEDDGQKEEPQLGLWNEFLSAIREQRMSTYSFLTSGHFCGIENGQAIVCFSPENNYHKKHLEEKNVKQLLEETLKTIVGEPIKIKLIIESERSRTPPPPRTEEPAEEQARAVEEAKRKQIEQAMKDPIVKKTVELFKGRIVYVGGS
jgi:hypothetical protein